MDESAVGFILALGRALHRYGTPAHRLEEGLRNCCDRLGLEAELFTTPTTIIMSFGRPTELKTRMMRVEGGELDMGKLALVDSLADAVAAHRMTPADGVIELDAIVAGRPQFGRVISTIVGGSTAAALSVFFGGTLRDVAASAVIGLALGLLAQVARRSTDQARVLELVGAAFAAFTATIGASVWDINASIVTVASLIIFLPGMSLTVAMTELATRNLIAGTARLVSAVIVLLELVVGVALGEHIAGLLVHVVAVPQEHLPEAINWIALVLASLGAAVVVQARFKQFGWIIAGCVVAYIGSRAGTAWLGNQMGVLVGSFALGVMSNLYARYLDHPAQVVQVPAVFLLVPGSLGFNGMTALLGKNTLSGVETLFAMFVVAIAIVAGLLVANAVMPPRRSL